MILHPSSPNGSLRGTSWRWHCLRQSRATPIFTIMIYRGASGLTRSGFRLLQTGLLVGGLVACDGLQFKGAGPTGASSAGGDAGGYWDPGPVSIQVYPSTRLAVHNGQWYLEALIECLDEMGDSTKGVGRFQFELFQNPVERGDATGQRLYAWNVRLQTLEDQRRHYDGTLRTYQFRLKMHPLPGDIDQVVLRVMYDGEMGCRMEAQAPLPARIEGAHP